MKKMLVFIFVLILSFSFITAANCGKKFHNVNGTGLTSECCDGLKAIKKISNPRIDKTCDPMIGELLICLECGDGKCEKGLEDKCNCPEDCQSSKDCPETVKCKDGYYSPTEVDDKNCQKIICPHGSETINMTNTTIPANNTPIETKSKLKEFKIKIKDSDNLTEEGDKIFITNSNGRKAEIKTMPETASQTAIQKLGELNFTITLKEKDDINKTIIYRLEADKKGRMLGIFKKTVKIKAEVNAETGELLSFNKKPWWLF